MRTRAPLFETGMSSSVILLNVGTFVFFRWDILRGREAKRGASILTTLSVDHLAVVLLETQVGRTVGRGKRVATPTPLLAVGSFGPAKPAITKTLKLLSC
eukprot:CAMPEP_0177794132 /NCGR_PEP_ID=MMETSP0491_2-20121128/25474_1 /TAXON_ID=63592 /ORGANISM="Tetraselmis chuii, Strain PLY429" /LENGTH=99 /DNA_ID=CAMNT_0019316751 /DNA_START=378 /DNA_END=677 /DNA_ORIENTATION=+